MKRAELVFFVSVFLTAIFYIPQSVLAGNLSNGANTATSFQYPVHPTYYESGYIFGQDLGNSKYHTGQDIRASAGTPVFAAANGIIVYSDNGIGGWGWLIIIEHQLANGAWYYSLYGHLSSKRSNKESGAVYRGEQIGTISDADEFDANEQTCYSPGISCGTAPHLHFAIREGQKKDYTDWAASKTTNYPNGWVNPKDFIDVRSKIPITGRWAQGRSYSFGTYDTNTCVFTPDYGSPILFGDYGDVPVTGDWTGDGITKIGVFRPKDAATQLSTFYLQDITPPLAFATPTDWPIIGDWHGDGRDDIGIYRIGEFHLYSRNTGQSTQVALGLDGDMPLTGDWNKDGKSEIGIFRRTNTTNQFYFDIGLTGGEAEYGPYEFGDLGDIPIVGDWNAGGSDKIGVFRPSNGIFYPNSNIPDISSFDTTPPVVYYFYIPSVSVILNNPFTISYSVSDSGGSGLNRVELWRANDNNGTPSGWVELKRNSHTGNGPIKIGRAHV